MTIQERIEKRQNDEAKMRKALEDEGMDPHEAYEKVQEIQAQKRKTHHEQVVFDTLGKSALGLMDAMVNVQQWFSLSGYHGEDSYKMTQAWASSIAGGIVAGALENGKVEDK